MSTRLPWWREQYERAPQTDYKKLATICLKAGQRALDEDELNVAFWWLNTAAMHCQQLKERQNLVTGKRDRRP